jgi:hypothetical protein
MDPEYAWSEEQLARVDRAKHDPEAFGELYEMYCDRIYATRRDSTVCSRS